MTTLTRRYHFSASHRLHSAELNALENEALYGKCNNPYGHGHNYVLAVTVAGEVDGSSGLICPIGKLDSLVRERVLDTFSHRNLNQDVKQFSRVVPTTENVALFAAELLQSNWESYWQNSRVWLHRIHIQETGRNEFEILISKDSELPVHV